MRTSKNILLEYNELVLELDKTTKHWSELYEKQNRTQTEMNETNTVSHNLRLKISQIQQAYSDALVRESGGHTSR